jgi:hypothetical protein
MLQMQTPDTLRAATNLALLLIVLFVASCADTRTRLPNVPTEGVAQRQAKSGTVVLFRVAAGDDGKPTGATLSTLPKWKRHYLVNVGPLGHPLDPGRTFGAGQLDAAPRQAGWGVMTLPAGTYQLAFAAYRTRFAMPGAKRAALGFGQSGAFQFEVPAGTALLYVGTFDFTCHNADRWWGYVEHECTKLEVRGEQELALQVASGSLSRFGPLHTALASTASVEHSR